LKQTEKPATRRAFFPAIATTGRLIQVKAGEKATPGMTIEISPRAGGSE
jgi:hypothetical protein